MLLLFLQVMFAGSFDVPARRTCSCSRRSPSASLLQALLATFTMLALSSLSKSSRYVGILYAGIIFFTAAIYGAMLAITGSTHAVVALARREPARRSSTSSSG